MVPTQLERRFLQVVVAILSLVPIAAGLAGVIIGPAFLGAAQPWPTDLDSHLRFLSGVFLMVGLVWLSCVPAIETKKERFRLMALITFTGGLARLYSLGLAGLPSPGHRFGLCMELLVVPALVVWQSRIARGRSS